MKTLEAIELFIKSRQARGLSKRTIQWYRSILSRFAGMFPELPENPEAIDEFLISCRGGDERRHGYFRTIRVFYHFLTRRYKVRNIAEDIESPIRRRKSPKPLTLDELDQLLTFPHILKVKALLLFLADSGARIGEAANLRPEDVYMSEWGPLARVRGKTGERIVPISETTYNMILKVLPLGVKVNQLTRWASWAFRDAHVQGTAHRLRHTFGTYWNGDELVLQDIMGHSNISTTERYRAMRTEKMCKQHHQYTPLKALDVNRQLGFFKG